MSKFPIILTVVLFMASTAVSENTSVSCFDELEDKIYLHRKLLIKQTIANVKKFDENFDMIKPNQSAFWEITQKKVNSRLPKFKFDGGNLEISLAKEINDSSCRQFVKNFENLQIAACSSFAQSSIIADKNKIVDTVFDIITYINGLSKTAGKKTRKNEAKFDEVYCKYKIERMHEITAIIIYWIADMMDRVMHKMNNFVGDLSFCLMFLKGDGSLLNEWKEACSYYDIV